MPFLFTAISYVKKYWQYLVIFVLFAFGYYELNRDNNSVGDALRDAQARHDAELKAIRDAQAVEDARRSLNQKIMQDTLERVEKQYQDAQRILDDRKRAEIKKIVDATYDNPDALAILLQESTGFSILPKGTDAKDN